MYQLKNSIEGLFRFHLVNSNKFNSIKEAAEFLDLTTDKEQLNRRIELASFGLKYRGYKK